MARQPTPQTPNAAALERRRTETARANAEAARAQAEAARAQAEAARIQAAAALAAQQAQSAAQAATQAAAEREAERVRRAAEATARRQSSERARERLYQVGINIAAPVAGAGVGYTVARAYKKQTVAMVTAQAPQLRALAAQANRLAPVAMGRTAKAPLAAVKLAAIARTARTLRLTRGGPIGLGVGAVMLAEGAFSRFVLAPGLENPVAREAVSAVGTASLFAASMLVTKRAIQNRLMSPGRNPVHVAAIETARRITTGGGNVLQRMAAGQGLRQAIATTAGLRPMAPIAAAPIVAPALPAAARVATPAPAVAARPVLSRGVRATAVVAGLSVAATLVARFGGGNANASARGGATSAGISGADAVAGAGSAPTPAPAVTGASVVAVRAYMRRVNGMSQRVGGYRRHVTRGMSLR